MFKKAVKIILLLSAMVGLAAGTVSAQKAPSEYEVKAAFLYNFIKFVEWPTNAFPAKDSPIVIGVLGSDPFLDSSSSANYLEQAIAGKSIEERKVIVRHLERTANLKDCQLLFVSASEKSHLKEILDGLRGDPVLTVSETDNFCEQGGIINFIKQSGKVRFEINPGVAEQGQLKISSRLLNVAKIVSAQPRKNP